MLNLVKHVENMTRNLDLHLTFSPERGEEREGKAAFLCWSPNNQILWEFCTPEINMYHPWREGQ